MRYNTYNHIEMLKYPSRRYNTYYTLDMLRYPSRSTFNDRDSRLNRGLRSLPYNDILPAPNQQRSFANARAAVANRRSNAVIQNMESRRLNSAGPVNDILPAPNQQRAFSDVRSAVANRRSNAVVVGDAPLKAVQAAPEVISVIEAPKVILQAPSQPVQTAQPASATMTGRRSRGSASLSSRLSASRRIIQTKNAYESNKEKISVATAETANQLNNNGNADQVRIMRRFRNRYIGLSSSPIDRYSYDIFAGALRGNQ